MKPTNAGENIDLQNDKVQKIKNADKFLENVGNVELLSDEDYQNLLSIPLNFQDFEAFNLSDLQINQPLADEVQSGQKRGLEQELENAVVEKPNKKKKTDLAKLREYRSRYIFVGESLPMTREEIKERLVPKDARIETVQIEGEKEHYLVDGKEVITLNALYRRRDKKKKQKKQKQFNYFFRDGEPVPAEKITDEVIENKKIDGKSIITGDSFYSREYKLVGTGEALTLPQKKQLQFKLQDRKLYYKDQEVFWDSPNATKVSNNNNMQLAADNDLFPIQARENVAMEARELGANEQESDEEIKSWKAYKNRYMYIDDIDVAALDKLSKQEKINRLVPKNVKIETRKNKESYANGRRVIKFGSHLQYIQYHLYSKFFFETGEPVPINKITANVRKERKLNGRKVITDEAFYNGGFWFVDNNQMLTDLEKKQVKFNRVDQKLYVDDREVLFDPNYKDQLKNNDTQIVENSVSNNHESEPPIASLAFSPDITAAILSTEVDPFTLDQEPTTTGLTPTSQMPGFTSDIVCAQSITLSAMGITLSISLPITAEVIPYIQGHFTEIQKLCWQNFYRTAYAGAYTPTTFASAVQQATQQTISNNNNTQINPTTESIKPGAMTRTK